LATITLPVLLRWRGAGARGGGVEKIAFNMQLLPGQACQYRRRHDEIWPQLLALLHDAGIRDDSIFLDEGTNILFAVLQWRAYRRLPPGAAKSTSSAVAVPLVRPG
jgi:L-rhamnose mutarotase